MAPRAAFVRPSSGQKVKTLFTIVADARYVLTMLLFLAVAIATAPPSAGSATVRAMATIRVVQAARIRFGRPGRDLPRPRVTVIRTAEGTVASANLIEFQ